MYPQQRCSIWQRTETESELRRAEEASTCHHHQLLSLRSVVFSNKQSAKLLPDWTCVTSHMLLIYRSHAFKKHTLTLPWRCLAAIGGCAIRHGARDKSFIISISDCVPCFFVSSYIFFNWNRRNTVKLRPVHLLILSKYVFQGFGSPANYSSRCSWNQRRVVCVWHQQYVAMIICLSRSTDSETFLRGYAWLDSAGHTWNISIQWRLCLDVIAC